MMCTVFKGFFPLRDKVASGLALIPDPGWGTLESLRSGLVCDFDFIDERDAIFIPIKLSFTFLDFNSIFLSKLKFLSRFTQKSL